MMGRWAVDWSVDVRSSEPSTTTHEHKLLLSVVVIDQIIYQPSISRSGRLLPVPQVQKLYNIDAIIYEIPTQIS